jgi:hypothetical protein
MGRHSLPEDDEAAAGTELAAPELDLDDAPRGRHSWRPGAEQSVVVLERAAAPSSDTAPVPVVADTPPVPVVADSAPAERVAEAGPVPARKASGTRGDLALLRADRALRIRACVAVLAPFVLYVLLLAVLGRLDALVLWVWIPVIVAGVAFGAVLDAGYRRAARSRRAAAEDDFSG